MRILSGTIVFLLLCLYFHEMTCIGQDISKIETFISYIRNAPYPPEIVKEIEEDYKKTKKYSGFTKEFISLSLVKLEPDFRKALKSSEQEYYNNASIQFMEIIKYKKNPYLVAESTYFLARTQFLLKKYEEASSFFSKFLKKHIRWSTHDDESLFYLGLTYIELLEHDLAVQSLREFLRRYPDASSKMRVIAEQNIENIENRGKNEILRVADNMKRIELKLKQGETSESTQKRQDEIVRDIDRLIEKLNNKNGKNNEKSGKQDNNGDDKGKLDKGEGKEGKGKSNQSGNNSKNTNGNDSKQGTTSPSTQPAQSAFLVNTKPQEGQSSSTGTQDSGKSWGELPQREREAIIQILKDRFPERYRKLLEEYYKNFEQKR